ncbi:PREDICTED: cyclic nucleotide-gated cation channel beta-1-like [Elephantulus edwardii]|uniref:cyclic nucleotide-gated cation channel beta-1-like n=1 Tax=Elephantulus edwardii TaxID=28737 RepID=UPI0003F09F56|nr:PREDICTED: cyclic nucleotide-gated cation channel beta-1-like [Elephantulus edwardii]
MEKENSSTFRRHHRPVPGAPPLGATSGHYRATSEAAELQRSKSAGSLHQKGDPPSCIQKPPTELESEDQGKDSRSDGEDYTCQKSPEKDTKEENLEALEKLDQDGEKVGPEVEKSDSEARTKDEPEKEEDTDTNEAKKPSAFVEIDLGDHAEEVVACTLKEDKQIQMDPGYLSEDEIRTSWVCCIPYTTKKKAKESA